MRIRPSSKKTLKSILAASGLILVILSAPLPAGEPLEQRVQRYWAARAANDLQTVYGLESASLPGGWLTPDQYKLLGGLPVREVKILETKIEGDKAIVKIQGQVAVGALGWTLQTLDDKWALINDEWYHQTRKSE